MEDNQTVDNDLQKAIDNITNTTNVDPVFSDPVAAPSSVPEGDTGELGDAVGPFPEPGVEIPAPAPEPIAPLESVNLPELNAPSLPQQDVAPPTMPEPVPTIETQAPNADNAANDSLKVKQIKEAALRDLVPVIGSLNLDPSRKFKIYGDIFEELRDYSVLEPAYQAAKEIKSDSERAEALLCVVEAIDKM
ncbi:hypothetical protein IKG10_00270 [Candidatus Saccharibacteria bacterium]|nr:hypothetical protein [Candidatus Saccharibacteria bacterium]